MTLLPPTLVVVPDKTLDAVRSALPELADEIHTRPQDATVLINVFAALVQLLATAVTLYQIIHPQAPTPPQIVEIFNQTYNVVNHTTIVNPPPAAGAG
jgi:hypothetical protein